MERQVSTIHINKFVDLPDGSTVQIVASGPLLTFLVIQKQQNGSRILYGVGGGGSQLKHWQLLEQEGMMVQSGGKLDGRLPAVCAVSLQLHRDGGGASQVLVARMVELL